MSGSRFVDVDRFEGASSLTELFETDALLDAIGGRDASYAELLGRPGARGESDRAIFLLRALTESVDASLGPSRRPWTCWTNLPQLDAAPAGLPELDGTAAAAAVRPQSRAAVLRDRGQLAVDPLGGNAFRRLASRTVPRHLPRANRFVAAAAGAMIVLSGGGLAAAATTSPGHGWGPLAPLSRVLHPGWTDDSVAAKRAVVVRELQTAVDQSRSGQKVAATATYRVASRQAHDLPSGPDATLRAQMAAVAEQLGLTDDPTSVVMPPVDLTAPVTHHPSGRAAVGRPRDRAAVAGSGNRGRAHGGRGAGHPAPGPADRPQRAVRHRAPARCAGTRTGTGPGTGTGSGDPGPSTGSTTPGDGTTPGGGPMPPTGGSLPGAPADPSARVERPDRSAGPVVGRPERRHRRRPRRTDGRYDRSDAGTTDPRRRDPPATARRRRRPTPRRRQPERLPAITATGGTGRTTDGTAVARRPRSTSARRGPRATRPLRPRRTPPPPRPRPRTLLRTQQLTAQPPLST